MKLWALLALGCVGPEEPSVLFEHAELFAIVGEPVEITVREALGERFEWDFGDGTGRMTETAGSQIHTWENPGHFSVYLTSTRDGSTAQAKLTAYVTYPLDGLPPRNASSVQVIDGTAYVVMEDFDRVAVVDPSGLSHLTTCSGPKTLNVADDWLAVACADDDQLFLRQLTSGAEHRVQFPYGSRPFGVVLGYEGEFFATLQGTGSLAVGSVSNPDMYSLQSIGPDPRGLAIRGSQVLASRHRSGAEGGSWFSVRDDETTEYRLEYDPGPDSDNDARGLPTYLQHIAINPDGRTAVISGQKSNIERGLFLEGRPFSDESLVRADLRQVDLSTGEEGAPLTLDNRDRIAAAAFDPRGHLLAIVTAGAQSLEIVNPFTQRVIGGALSTGYGARGVAFDQSGRVWVDAASSRELAVYSKTDDAWQLDQRISLADGLDDPLGPETLRGKQLFHDSADPRLTAQGYVACASCHLDGESDRLVWDFTDRGEGLRNTPALAGVFLDGPLHWTGNFDEVQDFENDIRNHQGGAGLMDDPTWTHTANPLSSPKAGYSEDLDALASYVFFLSQRPLRSAARSNADTMSVSALDGQAIFLAESTGCIECHPPPHYTDSQWLSQATPLLHDVGTLTEASGQRVGQPLTGLDTPSLLGLHDSSPFLHDGSYETVLELLQANPSNHGKTVHLSQEQMENLAQFLLELE